MRFSAHLLGRWCYRHRYWANSWHYSWMLPSSHMSTQVKVMALEWWLFLWRVFHLYLLRSAVKWCPSHFQARLSVVDTIWLVAWSTPQIYFHCVVLEIQWSNWTIIYFCTRYLAVECLPSHSKRMRLAPAWAMPSWEKWVVHWYSLEQSCQSALKPWRHCHSSTELSQRQTKWYWENNRLEIEDWHKWYQYSQQGRYAHHWLASIYWHQTVCRHSTDRHAKNQRWMNRIDSWCWSHWVLSRALTHSTKPNTGRHTTTHSGENQPKTWRRNEWKGKGINYLIVKSKQREEQNTAKEQEKGKTIVKTHIKCK